MIFNTHVYLTLETALWACVTIVTTSYGQVAGDQCSSPWVQYRDSCYIFATGYPEDWTEAGVCNVLSYLFYFTMAYALERVISSWKVKCMLSGILHVIMTITNTSVDFGKNFH